MTSPNWGLKSPLDLFSRFFQPVKAQSAPPSPLIGPISPVPIPSSPVQAEPDLIAMGAVSRSTSGKALSLSFLEKMTPAAAPAPAPAMQKIEYQKPVQLREGVMMYMPQNPLKVDQSVDVIIQFRGDVPQRFAQSGVPAVVISAETSGLSGAMMEKFGQKEFVPQILETVKARLEKQYGPQVKIGRLALGSFSAGYAPLQVALSNPAVSARTDAVMVIDGIHYGAKGKPNPAAHQPFVDFAKAAAAGQKMMVITHSAIQPSYSSSTDAADYILKAAGAQRQPLASAEPDGQDSNRYKERIAPANRADRGSFHVEGFAGNQARNHVEQIDNLGNLWARYLAPRWNTSP
ncbi:hypothetical protein COW36_08800 [bacterium (Candidatus Blackallbacteria) CG17_big_fil_post_rev_8_21_14_2_50_48_46]|uniref:Uncharacterized protein n=1 Tax=bacterium (Candidatus Blackallbacteria) CG17_big_fil_post_rev_8_21_14_2_50_48_46 TaxID=2014261 RepID=A0A2M7G6Q6_9BACT|nr:MAG: hypothetical protein COW64_06100 [bacterium (Candidatus Blackallbacteria) CG18_big_fil_WC_8_21_14_2_50_49_26]PIW17583.1 MAG: hypothetical protein COW36_08800 [bacterium (Candidatus Blackallbacteria) CG17_big_fil_post_rev_8_21_14_2_50_48_46]PIW48438.1 MAG: hypothetical protein COW20_10150 [bacterium (Candidatus Blackallbacteria) CG13_big_fil_rev_8_21_14_2_50_49_14]